MGEISIQRFQHLDDGAEAFLALPRAVEGLTDGQAAAERAGTEALLDARNSYYQHSDAMNFVALRDGRPVGRITAFDNRRLTEDNKRYGLAGLFCCQDDVPAAQALGCHAADWLAGQGATMLRGPMAGDIWHRWRFMTRGFDTEPFPGEPRNPEYYPALFGEMGFAPVRTYSTKLVANIAAQYELLAKPLAFNTKRGVGFRNMDRGNWQDELKTLYELCRHSFATNWGVTETTEREFVSLYDRWLTRVGPEYIIFAVDDKGGVIGLGLALTRPADTINLKTIAVLPGQYGFHLGQAIAGELYRRAIDAGMTKAQHCLMGPLTPAQRWDRGLGRVTREYTMYERAI